MKYDAVQPVCPHQLSQFWSGWPWKVQNIFVQIAKYIFPNCLMYLFKSQTFLLELVLIRVALERSICSSQKCKTFLFKNLKNKWSKLQKVFVEMTKYICPNAIFFITPHLSQYWPGWPLKVQVVMWDCNERALLWRSSFGGVSLDSGASSQKMCPVQKDANDMMEFSFFDKKPFLQWKLLSHLTLT